MSKAATISSPPLMKRGDADSSLKLVMGLGSGSRWQLGVSLAIHPIKK